MKANGDRGYTTPLMLLTSQLKENKRPATAALPPNKELLLPIQQGIRRLCGRFGEEKYIFSLKRFDSRLLRRPARGTVYTA
jgi:hypothetical protein